VTPPRTGYLYLDAVLDQPGSVLAFAHRGGAYHPDVDGLENTLQAFAHAVGLGYGYLETDVHVTSDGVLLAFHDTVLDRVTDATGRIATSTYAEVQRARINGSDPVPTLAELFDEFPEARFNIDLKAPGAVRHLEHPRLPAGQQAGDGGGEQPVRRHLARRCGRDDPAAGEPAELAQPPPGERPHADPVPGRARGP
jgi:glycerophosphoryl diester phosphodiesterase